MFKILTIPAMAFAVMGTGAIAQNATGTVGGGAAAAGADGAVAGGLTAGGQYEAGKPAQGDKKKKADRRAGRDDRRADRPESRRAPNSASTYGAGAVHTTRNSAAAGVTSGGSAQGSGSQNAGTTVDAYGETTRDGSSADIYGDSVANSTAEPR